MSGLIVAAGSSSEHYITAGAVLAGALDESSALRAVAMLAVPRVADWARVDMVHGGQLRTVAIEHVEPRKVELAQELSRRYPERADAKQGPQRVVRTGKSELVTPLKEEQLAALASDERHLELLRELGLRGYVCAPLTAHGHVLGAISFGVAESNRRYGRDDLALAEELARRAGIAVQHARLYREVEERAQAARVLESVGDGVMALDAQGRVLFANAAVREMRDAIRRGSTL
jgi:GAF domain-containing protein